MKVPSKKSYDIIENWFSDKIVGKRAPFSVKLSTVKGLNGAKEDATSCIRCLEKRWTVESTKCSDERGSTFNSVYFDPESSLSFTLEAKIYRDVPVLDYTVTVKNTGEERSPVISELCPLDALLPIGDKIKLETANGSIARANDFEEKDFVLESEPLHFEEKFGRSTDDAWPYFALDGEKDGFFLAIGWSGNWSADFIKEEGGVRAKVGMYAFNAFLLPGESVRTERIVLMYNEGDNEYGHNLFRKTVVAHYTPYCDKGEEFVPPIFMNFWGGRNTAYITKVAQRMADFDIKVDGVWMDAAWYGNYPYLGEDFSIGWNNNSGGPWYVQLGVWDDNRNLYPHGIKEVGDYLHEHTPYKLMLWWMLEDGRINPYKLTYTDKDGVERTVENDVLAHQTFGKESYYKKLIDIPGGRAVLKLSDEKVFAKVLNYYRNRFSNGSLDYMRIDYWSRPAEAWVDNDIEEATELCSEEFKDYRSGMTENKYVLNLYRLFDTMYEEFPGWLLDNCCSGGRRIDIEMAKRGIPLWRTDYNNVGAPDYCEAQQVQTQYLHRWLPFTGIGCAYPKDGSTYYQRSFIGCDSCIATGKWDDGYMLLLKEMVDDMVSIRPFMSGDYYQLLPVANNKTDWQSFELYREDLDAGVMVAMIRAEEKEAGELLEMALPLKGLDPEKSYTVHDMDDRSSAGDYLAKGSELMEKGIIAKGEKMSIHAYFFTAVK